MHSGEQRNDVPSGLFDRIGPVALPPHERYCVWPNKAVLRQRDDQLTDTRSGVRFAILANLTPTIRVHTELYPAAGTGFSVTLEYNSPQLVSADVVEMALSPHGIWERVAGHEPGTEEYAQRLADASTTIAAIEASPASKPRLDTLSPT